MLCELFGDIVSSCSPCAATTEADGETICCSLEKSLHGSSHRGLHKNLDACLWEGDFIDRGSVDLLKCALNTVSILQKVRQYISITNARRSNPMMQPLCFVLLCNL